MSRPGKRHGLVCANVAGILRNNAIAVKKVYVCSNDTGVVVERDPDTVRGPDVMFFEDVGTFDEVESKFGETPPLLAVEVLEENAEITGEEVLTDFKCRVTEFFAMPGR